MVALLGFFQDLEVFVQEALLGEGDAVDAGELLTLLIASPVGAGEGQDLHGLDHVRVLQVRSAAEVGELAVGIVGDGTVFQFGNQFLLVLVSFFGEIFEGIGLGDLDAAEVLLLTGEFQHLVLDGFEIRVRKGAAAHVHVIVEAVFNGRADTELHPREQGLKGLCHQV